MLMPYSQRSPGSNASGVVRAAFLQLMMPGRLAAFTYWAVSASQRSYVNPAVWVSSWPYFCHCPLHFMHVHTFSMPYCFASSGVPLDAVRRGLRQIAEGRLA